MKRRLLVLAGSAAMLAAITGVAAAGASPSTSTGTANQIKQSSALLHGTVNPNGSSTTYYFQWGVSTSYGTNGAPLAAGAGTKSIAVSQTAAGLTQGTTYHYRLVATNQFGTTYGADRSFKTTGHLPPGVLTGAAVKLATTGATLTGVVYPQGQKTSWYFQWGTNSGYVNSTVTEHTPAVQTPQLAAASLEGMLAPATIYHFRLVATNAGATSYGQDGIFMTYPSPRPTPKVTASTKPAHARRSPYVFTTTGRVTGPSWIPSQFDCNGNVTIRFFRGLRQVGFTLAGIQPNCTFSGRTVFSAIPGGRRHHPRRAVQLRVVIRSISNNYLATNRAPIEYVRLG